MKPKAETLVRQRLKPATGGRRAQGEGLGWRRADCSSGCREGLLSPFPLSSAAEERGMTSQSDYPGWRSRTRFRFSTAPRDGCPKCNVASRIVVPGLLSETPGGVEMTRRIHPHHRARPRPRRRNPEPGAQAQGRRLNAESQLRLDPGRNCPDVADLPAPHAYRSAYITSERVSVSAYFTASRRSR
jgi:hypothetical protein